MTVTVYEAPYEAMMSQAHIKIEIVCASRYTILIVFLRSGSCYSRRFADSPAHMDQNVHQFNLKIHLSERGSTMTTYKYRFFLLVLFCGIRDIMMYQLVVVKYWFTKLSKFSRKLKMVTDHYPFSIQRFMHLLQVPWNLE